MGKLTKYALLVFIVLSGYTEEALGCGDNCAICLGVTRVCNGCKHRYWLHNNVCKSCPDNCEQCKDNSNCTSCKAKFWGTGTCDKQCPDSCDANGCNDDIGQCFTCRPGLYGESCLKNCTLCKNGICDRSDGQCSNGCIDGYYEDTAHTTNKTCRKCSDNCKLCQSQGICSKCDTGFYIHSYVTNNETGNTVAVCPSCLPICEECHFTPNNCTVCKAGTYGPFCQYNCSDSHCRRCNKADDVEKCTECTTGYIVNNTTCVLNKTCLQNCAKGCDENETCVGGCKDGWSGQTCTKPCANQCQKCDQDNDTMCSLCKPNFFGSSCEPCSENCSRLSSNQTCGINDGICSSGCKVGSWGNICNKPCFAGCNSSQCDQSDGSCETCHINYYGAACDKPCSYHCADNGSSLNICNKNNGTCIFWCEDGYNGDWCDQTTTTKESGTSFTTTTRKTSIVSTTKDKNSTSRPEETDQQLGIIIGAAAGGGVVIIAIVVIVIVCVVVRRNRQKNAESVGFIDVQDVQHQSQNDIDCLYAKPNKPTKEQSEDYVYAKQNKPVKEESHDYIYAMPNKPKNKRTEPTETHDNVVIDLDAQKETDEKSDDGHDGCDNVVEQETDLDEVLLENINDDENKDVFVEDVVIPSSDTYYNMAGLVRSRVQIAKLLDHIMNKAEFEPEFEKLPQGLTRTCNEAMKPHNRAKNRYNGIYAYDATRVVLQSNNFINANYVEGYTQSQVSYIASLGPTRSTMDKFTTFWEMIWQDKTNKIIMLTHLAEAEKMKCEQYWPDQGNENVYGDFVLRCTAEKIYSDFVVRELTVKKMSETRKVTQYHYTAWPDKTVPDNVASLVEFRDKVEQGRIPATGPMVVHCSAGIGRTGTYIALDILIREGKKEESVDVFGCVIALRGQRVNLVQNVEQYVFLHHCVLYALTCNADSLPVSTVQHTMTNEKITAQYQAFVEMQSLSKGDVRLSLKFQNQNRKEIRQGSDIPGDNYRVRLTLTQNDYINAIYVNGYKNEDKFIAAQTPLPNTLEDFVSMVYQESCPCVVCLDEENINDKTVGEYLPPANKVSTFGQFQVECLSSDSGDDFTVRELKLSRIGSPVSDELKVRHYQFKGWENSSSVPEHVQPFLKMIVDVEKTRHGQHTDDPVVVHCVTGAERSSLFCVVSILVEKCAAEKELSVLNTVCQVRSRRRSAIKDAEQLQFCYDCVKEIVEKSDTKTYYNMNNV